MKKNIIKIGVVLSILCISIFFYFNLIRPVKINSIDILCQNWDATYEGVKGFEKAYRNGDYNKDTTIIHNFNGKLPSDKPKDYMNVYITIDAENRCLFQHYSVDGYIKKIDKYKDMALYSGTLSDIEPVRIFRNDDSEGKIVLDIYVGNHTDDEIKEFIRSITIDLVSEGDFFGKQKSSIELSEVKKIEIER